jgi:hypothetical protein
MDIQIGVYRGERPGELLARSSPEPPQEALKIILVKPL